MVEKVEEYVWYLEDNKRSVGDGFMGYSVEFQEKYFNDYRLKIYTRVEVGKYLQALTQEEIDFLRGK